ncbi:MAG: DNA repair protein RecO [Candidatus Omnitrophica bacterium]|nr:DNA repair protein RecO [Candidatus Omnitrophota bacterium]
MAEFLKIKFYMVTKDHGFVLTRHNFRETSVIAQIFTLAHGKITGIFKGFYGIKKEFSTPLNLYTLNEFVFYPKKSEIWLMSFADIIKDYSFLRLDFEKAHTAAAMAHLINKVMPGWDPNKEIFGLYKACMDYLDKGKDSQRAYYVFIIKFLTESGFKPEFNRCISCGEEISKNAFFSVKKGGIICDKCVNVYGDVRRISHQAIACLRYIQKADLDTVWRLNINYACEEEILFVLRQFLVYHIDFDIMPERFCKV